MKWVLSGAVGLMVLLSLLVAGADRYLSTERGARWLYSEVQQPVHIRFTDNQVRYLQIGDTAQTPLLLIHGAPGGLFDWLAMAKRDRLYDEYYLLIPERPGYGGTKPKTAEPSVASQAQALLPLLQGQDRSVVVMGHSYGAPIAVTLGALAPGHIKKIYGLSGAYAPDEEVTFGISYWIDFPLFRYILPCPLWVSNKEKLGHPQALREAVPLFQSVKRPITLFHGTSDALVPYGNSTYLQELIPVETELIPLPGQDHPVHVMLPDYFVDLLLGRQPALPEASH
ncbi:MAG: alpha/beta fold hydrolase [Phaeodactylibacter sp.]|uniref:alpha/beta fold hydrolase n=1 Tax=Phaeodactylibacter sp. TaxID=1940289 RepID=UPI0032EF3B84